MAIWSSLADLPDVLDLPLDLKIQGQREECLAQQLWYWSSAAGTCDLLDLLRLIEYVRNNRSKAQELERQAHDTVVMD